MLLANRKLTPNEFDLVKQHPLVGHDTLEASGIPNRITEMVLHHHRNYLGGGYPEDRTPSSFASQILHVADVAASVGKPPASVGVNAAAVMAGDPAPLAPAGSCKRTHHPALA